MCPWLLLHKHDAEHESERTGPATEKKRRRGQKMLDSSKACDSIHNQKPTRVSHANQTRGEAELSAKERGRSDTCCCKPGSRRGVMAEREEGKKTRQ